MLDAGVLSRGYVPLLANERGGGDRGEGLSPTSFGGRLGYLAFAGYMTTGAASQLRHRPPKIVITVSDVFDEVQVELTG